MTPPAPTPPETGGEQPALPVPPAPPRWRKVAVGLGLVAAVMALGTYAVWDRLLDGLAEVGHAVARLGDLAWRDPEGEWVPITGPDVVRRQWGSTDVFLTPAWTRIAPGLEVADLLVRRDPNPQTVDLALARVDPRAWRLRVFGTPEWDAETVEELRGREGLALAVNAAYFSDEGPLGLVVSDGVRRHRAVAHRAAHFLVDRPGAVPRIVNERRADVGGVDQGFQGFPSIMSGGVTYGYMRVGGRGFDVWNVDRRTAACTTRDDRLLLLVTDTLANGLSLAELATVLGGLGCVDAMGFDGGASTSMSIQVDGYEREVAGLRPVQVVLGLQAR